MSQYRRPAPEEADPLAAGRSPRRAPAAPPEEEGAETDVWGAAAVAAPPPAVAQPSRKPAAVARTASRRAVVPSGPPPTLVEAAEPVLQLVCRLNRAARKGGTVPPMSATRSQIRDAIEAAGQHYVDAHFHASGDAGRRQAAAQWQKAREPLIYFVDYQLRNSALPYAFDWRNLAEEEDFKGLAGDEEFFRHVSADLKKDSPTAMERLMLYHECMALGFLGMYQFEPEVVQQLTAKVRGRVATRVGKDAFDDPHAKVTPDAYAHNDETPLAPAETNRILVFILITTAALLVLLVALTFYVYLSATGRYVEDLERLAGEAEVPAQQQTGE